MVLAGTPSRKTVDIFKKFIIIIIIFFKITFGSRYR